jgi:photosystem II stability/assembly factor-like uncharacterized protein
VVLGVVASVAAPGWTQEETAEEVQVALFKPLASRSLLLEGTAIDGLLVAVGERGHILLSRDQGDSWEQATAPTRATLTGVFFHDPDLGWAVGHDAVILRTRDGGGSWELLHRAPEEERPLLDVWFENAERGFAIGAYSFFLETTDGGDTWSAREFEAAAGPSAGPVEEAGPAEDDEDYEEYEDYEGYDDYDLEVQYHLNRVARSETGQLFIAAEAGTIYRSDDAGETWISLPSPYEGSFFGTLPLAGDSLLLFGLRGHLFRSEDAGESWRELDSGTTAMLTDALILPDGTIVVVGLAGTVLVSRDGGEAFELRQQADRQGLAAILRADDGNLILIGEHGIKRLSFEALEEGAAP